MDMATNMNGSEYLKYCLLKDEAKMYSDILCCECGNIMESPVTVTVIAISDFRMCRPCYLNISRTKEKRLRRSGISISDCNVEPNETLKSIISGLEVSCKVCKWEGYYVNFVAHQCATPNNTSEIDEVLCKFETECKPEKFKLKDRLATLPTGIMQPAESPMKSQCCMGIELPRLYTCGESYKPQMSYKLNVAEMKKKLQRIETLFKEDGNQIQVNDEQLAVNAQRIIETKAIAQSVSDGVSEVVGLGCGRGVRRFISMKPEGGIPGVVNFNFEAKSLFRKFSLRMSHMLLPAAGYRQKFAGYCVNIVPCHTDPTSFCINIIASPFAKYLCDVKIEIVHPCKAPVTASDSAVRDKNFFFSIEDTIYDDTLFVKFIINIVS